MANQFFAGVDQVDLNIGEYTYKMPRFSRQTRACTAILPASLSKINKSLPDRSFIPAQVLPMVGGIQFAEIEYLDSDLGQFNEFVVGPVLQSPKFLRLPILNTVRQLMKMDFHLFISRGYETSEASVKQVVTFNGMNMRLGSINCSDEGEWHVVEVKEGDELFCTMKCRKKKGAKSGPMRFYANTYQQQPQSSEYRINALEYSLSFNPSNVKLELGDHPDMKEIGKMLYSTRPIMCLDLPSCQNIWFGPGNLSIPLIKSFMENERELSSVP